MMRALPPSTVSQNPIPSSPVHPLSALVTIVLDSVWGAAEGLSLMSVVGACAVPLLMLLTGGTCFAAVFAAQKALAGDGWGTAFAKAAALGVVAGVPFMVMGTAAGAFFLAWSGISRISGFLSAENPKRG